MKYFRMALCAVFVLGLAIQADARPDYKKAFDAAYKGNEKVAAAATEAKCNVCHYGKTKKNRNDYATALSKVLTKAVYTANKADKPALAKLATEAFKKIEGEKNADGKTFGSLLEAGSLPGIAPEE
ncbi:MAG: hypothetical protein ACI9HK_005562 [Pirellulaceae bacterium]|jgi:hypothetical protein